MEIFGCFVLLVKVIMELLIMQYTNNLRTDIVMLKQCGTRVAANWVKEVFSFK